MDVRKRIIGSSPHLETAGGQFSTDMAAPLKSCRISFSPIQEGEGDPSPSNVRPIKGWDGITVKRCGKNLWSFGDQTFTRYKEILFNEPLPKGIYTFSARVHSEDTDSTTSMVWLCYYDKGAYPRNGKHIERSDVERTSVTFDFTEDAPNRIRLYASTALREGVDDLVSYTDIQLELGSTATEYEPYTETSITIPFPQTIYGGYVDLVKGEVVDTWINRAVPELPFVKTSGSGSWEHRYDTTSIWRTGGGYESQTTLMNNAYCDMFTKGTPTSNNLYTVYASRFSIYDDTVDTAAAFKEKWTNCHFVYPVLERYYKTYPLDPQTIRALRGINNVFSDANGSVELTYWTH